jgi:multiple sugar transport system substrate-binding protein
VIARRTRWLPLLLLVTACGADRRAAETVELWAMGREGEVLQQLAPAIERQLGGVRLRVQQVPWSAAHEKLLTAYVGDTMPDVFQVGNTWIPELVALGALEPLDPWLARSAVIDAGDYFPGILDTNVVEGTTWGVPWYVDTRLLFYRADALADGPPATWAAWVETMTRVRARGGPDRWAILLPITEWQTPVILALQQGAPLLRDGERRGDFESPAFRTAFDFYLDLFRRDLAPRTSGAQVANLYQDFANGYVSFYVTGPWNVGEFRRRLPPAMAGRWGTAPMPAPDAGRPGVSLAGGASLALFRGSRKKPAAWRVVEALSRPAAQVEFHRLTGDLPSRKTAWAEGRLVDDPYARAFWEQLQHVRSTPKIPEWERIASKIGQYAEEAIRGRMGADEALARLDADVDALLEKRRWLLDRAAAR